MESFRKSLEILTAGRDSASLSTLCSLLLISQALTCGFSLNLEAQLLFLLRLSNFFRIQIGVEIGF